MRQLIDDVRRRAAAAVNAELTLLYWQVGDRINKDVLGEERAHYGEQIMARLADRCWAMLPLSTCAQSTAVVWRPEAESHSGTATGEVTAEVRRLVGVMRGEMKRSEIQRALGLKHEDHFREAYLRPALEAGVIEMTIPDKPRSSRQKYRLTAPGQVLLKAGQDKKEQP